MQQYDCSKMLHAHVRLLFTAAVGIASFAAEQFTGKVVGVTDGDTLKVMRAGAAVRVRLHGVDTPGTENSRSQHARGYSQAIWRLERG
jgi:endonuclease YncB( thermonuclease family)